VTPDGVVIVGAGLGGVRTAEQLRTEGYDGPITLVGAESEHPYDRPPLSKQVLRGEREVVRLRDPASYDEIGVDLRLGRSATSLDTASRTVGFDGGEQLSYQTLVIATGARPRWLPGAQGRGGVHVVRTASDSAALRAEASAGGRAVVVGGGFIGCEVAASLRTMELEVTLVEMAPAPLEPVLGPEVAAYVSKLHEAAGVKLVCDAVVSSLVGDERVAGVHLADGTVLPADVVVLGLGVVPDVEWLAGSEVEVDNGVRCDEVGRTSASDVFALGDVASWRSPRSGRHHRFEHWTSAIEQAAVVARQIATGDAAPYAAAPYFWSDQYKVKIQSLGVPSPTADVTIVELTEKKRVALYAEDGLLTAVVGFSSPSVVMGLRPMLTAPTPVEAAVQEVESRRTVSA
jgi:3-phenylpropionate/trans-cinnamate dioxygenase ferredoxin reductase subunit